MNHSLSLSERQRGERELDFILMYIPLAISPFFYCSCWANLYSALSLLFRCLFSIADTLSYRLPIDLWCNLRLPFYFVETVATGQLMKRANVSLLFTLCRSKWQRREKNFSPSSHCNDSSHIFFFLVLVPDGRVTRVN